MDRDRRTFRGGRKPGGMFAAGGAGETGLFLTSYQFRGLVTFSQEGYGTEYMCLFTADGFTGKMKECDEGVLQWVPKKELGKLNLWEGDSIFLELLAKDAPFFSLKLSYCKDELTEAVLDGKPLSLPLAGNFFPLY